MLNKTLPEKSLEYLLSLTEDDMEFFDEVKIKELLVMIERLDQRSKWSWTLFSYLVINKNEQLPQNREPTDLEIRIFNASIVNKIHQSSTSVLLWPDYIEQYMAYKQSFFTTIIPAHELRVGVAKTLTYYQSLAPFSLLYYDNCKKLSRIKDSLKQKLDFICETTDYINNSFSMGGI